ncbi:hypothetical protein T07_850 [Trichinella nelsoni]|uniref:Uncharacterized protein n=1 Tax=Trichinella nelsoni TaxID=6336 RepID=A0A0V0SDH2_9BILA|nr:hypothetical protein T07_850 [Trichinella nelsoni]
MERFGYSARACSGCKNQVGKRVVERQLDHRSNATLVKYVIFNSENEYQIRQSGIVIVLSNTTFSGPTLNEILIQKSRKLHKNFKDSSTSICLSCLFTLLCFLICNVVLTTCEITDCGVQSAENSFFLQHIVVFIGFQDGMMFKDCIGTIMPSAPNFTSSDTVITESIPMVVPGALFLENVHLQGIHIRRMSSPFGREEANAVNIPFNFAIIKLASHVHFNLAAIPVCLKSDLVINSNSTCYMPNIHSVFLNGFGIPFQMKIIHPLESCALLIPRLKLSPLKHICAIFIMPPVLVSSDLIPNSLFEGAPLLCLYQDRFYQVGIFDWLKIFKNNSTRPIALFSRVAAITPLIEQAIVNNISSEHNPFLSWIDF